MIIATLPTVNNLKSFNCNEKSQQQNLTQVQVLSELTLPLLTDTEITCTGLDIKNLGASSQKGASNHHQCER